jgi:hypothetical protein
VDNKFKINKMLKVFLIVTIVVISIFITTSIVGLFTIMATPEKNGHADRNTTIYSVDFVLCATSLCYL